MSTSVDRVNGSTTNPTSEDKSFEEAVKKALESEGQSTTTENGSKAVEPANETKTGNDNQGNDDGKVVAEQPSVENQQGSNVTTSETQQQTLLASNNTERPIEDPAQTVRPENPAPNERNINQVPPTGTGTDSETITLASSTIAGDNANSTNNASGQAVTTNNMQEGVTAAGGTVPEANGEKLIAKNSPLPLDRAQDALTQQQQAPAQPPTPQPAVTPTAQQSTVKPAVTPSIPVLPVAEAFTKGLSEKVADPSTKRALLGGSQIVGALNDATSNQPNNISDAGINALGAAATLTGNPDLSNAFKNVVAIDSLAKFTQNTNLNTGAALLSTAGAVLADKETQKALNVAPQLANLINTPNLATGGALIGAVGALGNPDVAKITSVVPAAGQFIQGLTTAAPQAFNIGSGIGLAGAAIGALTNDPGVRAGANILAGVGSIIAGGPIGIIGGIASIFGGLLGLGGPTRPSTIKISDSIAVTPDGQKAKVEFNDIDKTYSSDLKNTPENQAKLDAARMSLVQVPGVYVDNATVSTLVVRGGYDAKLNLDAGGSSAMSGAIKTIGNVGGDQDAAATDKASVRTPIAALTKEATNLSIPEKNFPQYYPATRTWVPISAYASVEPMSTGRGTVVQPAQLINDLNVRIAKDPSTVSNRYFVDGSYSFKGLNANQDFAVAGLNSKEVSLTEFNELRKSVGLPPVDGSVKLPPNPANSSDVDDNPNSLNQTRATLPQAVRDEASLSKAAGNIDKFASYLPAATDITVRSSASKGLLQYIPLQEGSKLQLNSFPELKGYFAGDNSVDVTVLDGANRPSGPTVRKPTLDQANLTSAIGDIQNQVNGLKYSASNPELGFGDKGQTAFDAFNKLTPEQKQSANVLNPQGYALANPDVAKDAVSVIGGKTAFNEYTAIQAAFKDPIQKQIVAADLNRDGNADTYTYDRKGNVLNLRLLDNAGRLLQPDVGSSGEGSKFVNLARANQAQNQQSEAISYAVDNPQLGLTTPQDAVKAYQAALVTGETSRQASTQSRNALAEANPELAEKFVSKALDEKGQIAEGFNGYQIALSLFNERAAGQPLKTTQPPMVVNQPEQQVAAVVPTDVISQQQTTVQEGSNGQVDVNSTQTIQTRPVDTPAVETPVARELVNQTPMTVDQPDQPVAAVVPTDVISQQQTTVQEGSNGQVDVNSTQTIQTRPVDTPAVETPVAREPVNQTPMTVDQPDQQVAAVVPTDVISQQQTTVQEESNGQVDVNSTQTIQTAIIETPATKDFVRQEPVTQELASEAPLPRARAAVMGDGAVTVTVAKEQDNKPEQIMAPASAPQIKGPIQTRTVSTRLDASTEQLPVTQAAGRVDTRLSSTLPATSSTARHWYEGMRTTNNRSVNTVSPDTTPANMRPARRLPATSGGTSNSSITAAQTYNMPMAEPTLARAAWRNASVTSPSQIWSRYMSQRQSHEPQNVASTSISMDRAEMLQDFERLRNKWETRWARGRN